MTEPDEAADIAEPNDAAEATENADAADPMDPIERTEPMDPIERYDPFEAIERNESSDQRLSDSESTARQFPTPTARAGQTSNAALDTGPIGTFRRPGVARYFLTFSPFAQWTSIRAPASAAFVVLLSSTPTQ